MKLNKYRILQALKEAPDDIKALTVSELIEKFTREIKAKEQSESEFNSKVIEEFTGAYIKVRERNAFGLDVDYIRIDELSVGSKTTEWEQLFDIKGEKVQFCRINNALIKLGSSKQREDSLSAKELRGSEIITKEDYEHAKTQLKNINKIIDKLKK